MVKREPIMKWAGPGFLGNYQSILQLPFSVAAMGSAELLKLQPSAVAGWVIITGIPYRAEQNWCFPLWDITLFEVLYFSHLTGKCHQESLIGHTSQISCEFIYLQLSLVVSFLAHLWAFIHVFCLKHTFPSSIYWPPGQPSRPRFQRPPIFYRCFPGPCSQN